MIQPETQGASRLRQRDTEAAGSSSPRFSSTPDLDAYGSSATRRRLHLWGVLECGNIVSNLQGWNVFFPVKIFVSFGRKLAYYLGWECVSSGLLGSGVLSAQAPQTLRSEPDCSPAPLLSNPPRCNPEYSRSLEEMAPRALIERETARLKAGGRRVCRRPKRPDGGGSKVPRHPHAARTAPHRHPHWFLSADFKGKVTLFTWVKPLEDPRTTLTRCLLTASPRLSR